MANILTINTNSTATTPALYVRIVGAEYVLVGQFSYSQIGKTIYFTGTSTNIAVDLTNDTATVNGTANLSISSVITALNNKFIS